MKLKKEKVSSINNSIMNLKKTLNQNDYDSIKSEIDKITDEKDSYYDTYIKKWKSELSSVEEQVYKKGCNTFKYKDLLRNPEEYKYKNAYFFGKVLQKVNSTQYRVGIDCTKYQYIDGYSCDNTIYVTYYGNTRIIEDDMIKMWGSMSGNYTYTSVLGASITIPSFYAKYITIQ